MLKQLIHWGSRTLIALLLTFTATIVRSAEATAFQKGDSVCLIGDSITHGGLYHREILLYYVTRFPSNRFDCFNCGISGDSAGGALRRFDYDIAAHHPTVASIMLGMNDVNRSAYGTNHTDEASRKKQKGSLDQYEKNMDELARRLHEMGTRLIFITPSIYDQTGHQETENLFGVNDALGQCGEMGRRLAAKYQGGVVDFHGPMSRINAELQARDPQATLVGKDRVHPGEMGHLVMAYCFLKGQGMTATVSAVTLDAVAGKTLQTDRCTVTGVKQESGGLSFTQQAEALPFPVVGDARKALSLVPWMQELDREMLTVSGLAPGSYALEIDGKSVQTNSAAEFAQGINLAENPATPEYQQALAVKAINDQRHTLVSGTLRTLVAVWHFSLSQVKGLAPDDFEGAKKVLAENDEKFKARNFSYGIYQNKTYRENKPRQAEIEKKVEELTESLWKLAIPQPHQFRIRKLD